MAKKSAGLVLYRRRPSIEVLLVHPGGPFWAKRDEGAWSIPKGEVEPNEDAFGVALREFREELGDDPPAGAAHSLGEIRQPGGKHVQAWGIEADLDVAVVDSNTFTMEWPPKSGRTKEFPEVDRAAWLGLAAARSKILPAQRGFLDRLEALVAETS
jgi:predicted NUDIX family NTP pyrophosphohydrolase